MFYIMLCFFMGITVKACDIPVENGTDVVTEDEKMEAGETETSEEPGSGAEAPAWTDGEPVNGAETPVQTWEESGSGAETPVPASEEPGSGAETPVPASEEPEIGAETPAWAEEDTEQVEEPGSGAEAFVQTVGEEEHAEASDFQAKAEWSGQGWIVKGFFRDFTPDIILVQPMCSVDGKKYWDCGQTWDLQGLSSEDEDSQEKLQNQRCLYDSEEPFKSYLANDLDRFFMKLRIEREDGTVCETQAAVIERKEMSPGQAEIEVSARFAPCMLVREGRPPNIKYYGRYQITVRAEASTEELTALLPETLPVEVQVQRGADYIGSDIVNCSVKWKPFRLESLKPGESVTVPDAAEEIVVPEGTVLHTQTGTYRLAEPVGMNQFGIMTDEVSLVFNVVAKDGQPEGMLCEAHHGLEMVFSLKPTGAEAIRAYFFREGDTEWSEIGNLSLLPMVDAQPATANSGYAVVLGKEQEPYRSYLMAQETGEEPVPFLVGLKIEGGVYDGRQLVLAWPGTYELPLQLPKMGGTGGNEGNAGSDDRGDSSESGQRPGLSEDKSGKLLSEEPKKERDQQPSELLNEKQNQQLTGLPKEWQDNQSVGKPEERPTGEKTGSSEEESGEQAISYGMPGATGDLMEEPVVVQAKTDSRNRAESVAGDGREPLADSIIYASDAAQSRNARNSASVLSVAVMAILLGAGGVIFRNEAAVIIRKAWRKK